MWWIFMGKLQVKIVVAYITLCTLSGCATHLTESGKRIRVYRSGSVASVKNCEFLSTVTGTTESFITNGDYGVIYATNDARNRAGNIPSADTLILTDDEPRRFGGEVTGIVYNCLSPRTVQSVKGLDQAGKNNESLLEESNTVLFEKAKKCQAKGGVWVNNTCVIPIE